MCQRSWIGRVSFIASGLLALQVWSVYSLADQPQRNSVLHLANGDHVTGSLVNANQPETLGWRSPDFLDPFEFALEGVSSIHFPVPEKLPKPTGTYCLELAGSEILYGALLSIDESSVQFDADQIGKLTIDRRIVQRLNHLAGGSEQIFVGPSSLNGWQVSGTDQGWREDAGNLVSDLAGSLLYRDFGLPSQVRIEFQISWTAQPDFELTIGVGEDIKTASRAFSFEVWENQFVVKRETEKEADVASLQKLATTGGQIHLQVFLDQQLGRLLVYSSNGDPLADLTVQSNQPQVLGGILINNRSGNIRLEDLRISRWNGELPRSAEVSKSRIHGNDGEITYGAVKSFDSTTREFVVGLEETTDRIHESKIQDVFLSQSPEVVPRSLRAVFLAGSKLGGELVKVHENSIILKTPGIQESIQVPMDQLQSLIVVVPVTDANTQDYPRERLEAEGIRLHGRLVDSTSGITPCLAWKPARSHTASRLRSDLAAHIIYRERVPLTPANPNQASTVRVMNARPGGIVGRLQEMFIDGEPQNKKKKSSRKSGAVLHLRTGDKLPCKVIGIDEQGVRLESSVTDVTFVPNEQIQVLELISDAPPTQIQSAKRQRLLTLPRMQRDNPPTHLVRSTDGDYLRGRIISMDEENLQIELRLEPKTVKRDRIVRILWLHPDELHPGENKEPLDNPTSPQIIQALQSDGNRLTFVAEQVSGTTLSGHNDLLGQCRIDLQQVDQLLIGKTVETAAASLPFHDWKLKPAADPLAPKEGNEDGGGDGEGQDSALVGKPAPDFTLDLLAGEKFKLSDHRQKVVVLDFWASWCGPCLQVMPQIDQVAHEFADQGVELFAVNLEESPEQIKTALERLKLSTAVVLDQNGRIAEKYGATSIPQTVIIDREGQVARVFVGGGARFDETLRAALKSVLTNQAPSDPTPSK